MAAFFAQNLASVPFTNSMPRWTGLGAAAAVPVRL